MGREIGRIYEWDRHVPPERRWYWSIFMIGASGSGIRTNGRAPTLEDATRQFEENWRRHLVWTKLEPPDLSILKTPKR